MQELSNDVLSIIFYHSKGVAFFNLAATCKRFHDLVYVSSFVNAIWERKINTDFHKIINLKHLGNGPIEGYLTIMRDEEERGAVDRALYPQQWLKLYLAIISDDTARFTRALEYAPHYSRVLSLLHTAMTYRVKSMIDLLLEVSGNIPDCFNDYVSKDHAFFVNAVCAHWDEYLSKLKNVGELLQANSYQAFRAVFKNRGVNISGAKWLWSIARAEQRAAMLQAEHHDAFISACANGHLVAVQWLWGLATAEQRAAMLQAMHYGAFTSACRAGKLAVAQWLWRIVTAEQRSAMLQAQHPEAFIRACGEGELEVVQWLWGIATAELKTAMLQFEEFEVFTEACLGEHLELAQWLWSMATDEQKTLMLETHGPSTFKHVCKNGCLAVAQWLWGVARDERMKAMLIGFVEATFQKVCRSKDPVVAQWLWGIVTDEQKKAMLQFDGYYVFKIACLSQHREVAQWLWGIATDEQKKAMLQFDGYEVFTAACQCNHLDVAQWLWSIATDDQKRAMLQFDGYEVLTVACQNEHLDVARWLWGIATVMERVEMLTSTYKYIVDNKKRTQLLNMASDLPMQLGNHLACRELRAWLYSIQNNMHREVMLQDISVYMDVFIGLCESGNIPMAKQLLDKAPAPRNLNSLLIEAFNQAFLALNMEMAQWLCQIALERGMVPHTNQGVLPALDSGLMAENIDNCYSTVIQYYQSGDIGMARHMMLGDNQAKMVVMLNRLLNVDLISAESQPQLMFLQWAWGVVSDQMKEAVWEHGVYLHAFKNACRRLDVEMVRWLWKQASFAQRSQLLDAGQYDDFKKGVDLMGQDFDDDFPAGRSQNPFSSGPSLFNTHKRLSDNQQEYESDAGWGKKRMKPPG